MPRPSPTAPSDTDGWWILDPRRSLRARATLFVSLGALAFTLLVAALAGTFYRRALERQVSASFETMAFQVADKLDRAVYERYRSLLLGANLAPIRDAAVPPLERRRVLDALQETAPEFAWIGLTDPTGRIVIGTGGLFETLSVATRPWFRGARDAAYAGPLRENPELARHTAGIIAADSDTPPRFLDLAVPVLNPNGEFAGVLAAHVRWSWAREVQLSVVPELTAREQIGVTVYAGNDVLLDSGASGWTLPPDAPTLPDNRRGRGALVENTSGGTVYLTGYARSRGFREYRGLGWLAVVRQPAARVFAPVTSLRRVIAAWGLTLTAIAAIITWIAAGRHARRLRSVRAAAQRIHEGDILAILPRPPGDSEVARMCGALGDLVEDLRAKQSGPVKDQTHS